MKKKIALVGAFDRYNYGDILMPIVFKCVNIEKEYEYNLFATRQEDMQYSGGLYCSNLNELYKNIDEYSAIIIIGGQCWGCNYSDALLTILDSNKKLEKKYLNEKRNSKKRFNIKAKKILKGMTPAPWIINGGKIPVIYNTVGGNIAYLPFKNNELSFKEYRKCWKLINNSLYISVRERYTYSINKLFVRKMKMYPDSVTMLSTIREKRCKNNVNDKIVEQVKAGRRYIVIQMNRMFGEQYIEIIAKEIGILFQRTGIKTFLLPLGYASGHDDQFILQEVYNRVLVQEREAVQFLNKVTVFDSIYVIANATAYCGTSLHGAITAISYGIPHSALSVYSKKLIRYLRTWKTTKRYYINPHKLAEELTDIIFDKNNRKYTKLSTIKQIELCKENNQNIISIIDGVI